MRKFIDFTVIVTVFCILLSIPFLIQWKKDYDRIHKRLSKVEHELSEVEHELESKYYRLNQKIDYIKEQQNKIIRVINYGRY